MGIRTRWKNADPLVKSVGIVFIIGHVLAEAHGFIRDAYRKIEGITLDLFWSSDFHLKLHAQTYIKTLFDDFLYVMILYAFAKSVIDRSIKVYMICIVWMIYHMADIICFMYDYKQSRLVYWAMTWCCCATTAILIMPKDRTMKMVK